MRRKQNKKSLSKPEFVTALNVKTNKRLPTNGFKKKDKSTYNPLSPYRRIWTNNHYKAKGLAFDQFMIFVKQQCHYCGEPPAKTNPYSPTWQRYKAQKSHSGSQEWYDLQTIEVNGIDKKEPCNDYNNLSNLVTCCATCNFLKGNLPYEQFIRIINKISQHIKMKLKEFV